MFSLRLLAVLLPLVHFVPQVNAWGALGHQTIAWIAQSYVSSTTKSFVQHALSSTRTDYMANVATWADTYRTTAAGHWSAPLHFIDANDSPPSSCSVEFDRDCGKGGCVVSAIVNYTSILLDSSATKAEVHDAMRFIIHFVGDIHQPLHDEGLDRGGNEINVTFNGAQTNLHAIWDTQIVEMLANGASAQSFGANLTQAINAGDYGWTDVSSWDLGMSLNDTQGTALGWASQANAYVCSDVLKGGIDTVETGDLDGAYFTMHGEVARLQIARAGYRLGKWLNVIATGSPDG